ncbi:hypothetical protein B0O80DRAFT_454987 [Mortierella sp. GBAus27b]|nr:hypothetical protein BGX31_004049 [Mortierella sp. GBA43]KAI8351916.1 hypothetical protein B0O80DRAFT_454987 [Mortierella sp. GBAus27b]
MEHGWKALDIPVVMDLITAYLEPEDLQHCLQVCRSFWTAFVPYLWNNLHVRVLTEQERYRFTGPFSPLLLESQGTSTERRSHYRHSVRSIQLMTFLSIWPVPDDNSASDSPTFPHLRRFKLLNQDCGNREATATLPRILDFLTLHTTLQEIELSYLQVEQDFMQHLLGTIGHLPALTALVLFVWGKFPLIDHLRLLEAGQRLEKLHLTMDSSLYAPHVLSEEDMETIRQYMAMMDPDKSCIKDLFLNIEFVPKIMIKYLKRCPRLERLTLRSMNAYTDLSDVIRDSCPRLKHLELTCAHIQASSQIRILSACCPKDHDNDDYRRYQYRAGLESLNIRFHGISQILVLNAVLDHRATLTTLLMMHPPGLLAADVHLIAKTCVQLKTWMVRVYFFDLTPIPVDDMVGEQWNCQHLKTFAILTEDHCTATGRDSAVKFLPYMYTQLSKLTALQVLSFQMGRAGWIPLRQLFLTHVELLYNLKQLRVLGLHKEEASMLDERLVEIMLEQWPKLERLGGLLESPRTKRLSEWLMEKRPDLDLTSLNHARL